MGGGIGAGGGEWRGDVGGDDCILDLLEFNLNALYKTTV